MSQRAPPSVTLRIGSSVSMRMRSPRGAPRFLGRRALLGENIMRVRDLYSPGAQVARPEQALAEAARTMLESHVGSLIVVETHGTARKPIGILTDRDIVRGQLRLGADLFCLTVGDVMTPDPLTITISMGVTEAIEIMRTRGV